MGKVGREPELKFSQNGTPICYVAVQTKEFVKGHPLILWYQVILFGNQAKEAKKSLTKGCKIYVEGRLRMVEMKDKTGKDRTVLEIAGKDFLLLDPKSYLDNSTIENENDFGF